KRPADAVIVPAMSIRDPAAAGASVPSRRSAATAAGTARKTLMNIDQRQSRYWVRAPPRTRPTAAPDAAIVPNTLNPRLRSSGAVNVVVRRLSAAGASRAAKAP